MKNKIITKFNSGQFRKGKDHPNYGKTSAMKGKHHTEITKDKIREASLGRYHSEETKEKLRQSRIGKPLSKEHCKKLSIAHMGYKCTEEQKRKMSEAHKGHFTSLETRIKIGNANRGEKSGMYGRIKEKATNWQGGITSLHDQIRHLPESKEWRSKVYIRDSYICVECGQVGGKLQAHHIKPFSKLLREFLQEYNQFSPFEDKDTLVRLAIKWQPFWDIDNGITMCKKCHTKTESYLNKHYEI